MYDLLITNARIVDGTGSPAFVGSVAVADGLIVEVGDVEGAAHQTIDAGGHLVTQDLLIFTPTSMVRCAGTSR